MTDEDAQRRAARDSALRRLARRDHSREELRRKLEQGGFEPALVSGVLDELQSGGWLSDERFAETFARARRDAGRGEVRIARELEIRGVATEHIDRVLGLYDESSWVSLAARVRVRRFGAELPVRYEQWAKQARFLQGRGFTIEQIRQALPRSAGGAGNDI